MTNGAIIQVLDAEPTEERRDLGHRAGGRRRVARRVIEAIVDEALDRTGVDVEQRTRIYRAGNHALTAIDEYLEDGDAALRALIETELRRQTEHGLVGEPIEETIVDPRQARPRHRQVVDAIGRWMREARAALTERQREIVVDHVRASLGSLVLAR